MKQYSYFYSIIIKSDNNNTSITNDGIIQLYTKVLDKHSYDNLKKRLWDFIKSHNIYNRGRSTKIEYIYSEEDLHIDSLSYLGEKDE